MDYTTTITVIFIAVALIEAIAGRFGDKRTVRRRDAFIEVIGTVVILAITVPTIMSLGALLAEAVLPGSQNSLAWMPWWAMFAVLLVGDDMTQYWWHRASHTFPWLYNLHRAHHSAEYMSVRIVYRNNVFYYALMPGLWVSAVLVHFGFGAVYAVYVVLKMSIIIGAHSSLPWDAFLYRNPALRKLAWIIERTVSTPATHYAHHGKHKADGVTNYKGNYGNMLFFWDVLFGTALITRRYPQKFGLENLAEESWQTELAWPAVPMAAASLPANNAASAIRR